MRILMIRLSAVGDVVRTLPALTCLRRAFPHAHIAWAVEPASVDLLLDQPDLDETIVFPRKEVTRAFLHPDEIGRARAALRVFLRSLRHGRYDLVIDFQGTLKTALMAALTRAPRRVGLSRGHAREMSWLFYNEPVALPAGKMSRVQRALSLVAHLGVSVERATSRIPENPADAAYVEGFLARLPRERGLAASLSAPAVVFPGTSRHQAYKRYPPARFARAADLIVERSGSPVVVAWGPGERELADGVIAAMKRPAILAPPLTLGQLTELIRRARVFLAGDTGPMHIAWTIGTPVVAIYGPTDPAINQPGGEFSTVAYRKVFCSPCRNRGCIARTCLDQLPPEMVADAAASVMARAEAAGRAALRPSPPARAADPDPPWQVMGAGAPPP